MAPQFEGDVATVDLTSPMGDELHAALRAAAQQGPTANDAVSGARIVLHYDDVQRLAHDSRVAGVGLAVFDLLGIGDGPLRRWYGGIMFTTEGTHHDRLRRLVSRAFTPRAVEALRSQAAALAASSLQTVRRDGGGDLNSAFARLPMQVMCRLLGVPPDTVDEFAAWADVLSVVFNVMTPEQIQAAESAIDELLTYVGRLVELRRADPGSDLITALLEAEADGNKLTHDEVVAMVANLLVGGHDTTASQLACTLHTMLRHSEEFARVRQDGSLLPHAIAETIRFEPSIPAVPRTATGPVQVGDAVPAGALMYLCTASANRDPAVWDDGDVLDVGRFADGTGPRLLSFGAGTHYCLGAALARLTLEEGVRAVLDLGPIRATEDPATVPWRLVLGRAPQRVIVELP
jgi:cytochrome P450